MVVAAVHMADPAACHLPHLKPTRTSIAAIESLLERLLMTCETHRMTVRVIPSLSQPS
jgi:hypothetical protein